MPCIDAEHPAPTASGLTKILVPTSVRDNQQNSGVPSRLKELDLNLLVKSQMTYFFDNPICLDANIESRST
jgi:hypothetical protein